MKSLRYLIPAVGFLALIVLFLLMPEIPSMGCQSCSSNGPYIPLIGAAYFSVLIILSLLFLSFPGRTFARGGLTWAALLALVMTYLKLPGWCPLCLIAHACHILIWWLWLISPVKEETGSHRKEGWCLLLFAPLAVVALFSSLNLTFMAYNFKNNRHVSLQRGDDVPFFSLKTSEGRTLTHIDVGDGLILNFVSPGCSHCQEQLEVLKAAGDELALSSYRFIHISSALSTDLIQAYPAADWVEDQEGHLRKLFKVSGYPTMFVIGRNGKISQVIPGVPDQLKTDLIANLKP